MKIEDIIKNHAEEVERIVEESETKSAPAPVFSENFEAHMTAVIKRAEKNKKTHVFPVVRVAVAAVLVMVVLAGFTTLDVDAVQKTWKSLIITSDSADAREDFNALTLTYIPDDFEIMDKSVENGEVAIWFIESTDGSKFINIYHSLDDATTQIDTDGIYRTVQINGNDAYIFYDGNINSIFFYQDGYQVQIVGSVDEDTIIKIAEGIKTY